MMAPEVFLMCARSYSLQVIKQTGHNLMADIWSLGCCVWEMLTSKPPYYEIFDRTAAMFFIASLKSTPALPEEISDVAKTFLRRCLQIDPRDRPSADELLKDPFLRLDLSGEAATALQAEPGTQGTLPPPIVAPLAIAPPSRTLGSPSTEETRRPNAPTALFVSLRSSLMSQEFAYR